MKLTESICVNCATKKGSCAERGNTSLSEEHGQKRYWRMSQKKSTKEYKVSGSRSPLQRSPGAGQGVFGHGLYYAGKSVTGRASKRISGKKASSANGPMLDSRKLTTRLPRMMSAAIAPVDGMGGVTLSYVCPHCNCFPFWRITSGGCLLRPIRLESAH